MQENIEVFFPGIVRLLPISSVKDSGNHIVHIKFLNFFQHVSQKGMKFAHTFCTNHRHYWRIKRKDQPYNCN